MTRRPSTAHRLAVACTAFFLALGAARGDDGPSFELSVAFLTRGGYQANALRDALLVRAEALSLRPPQPLASALASDELLALVDDSPFWLGFLTASAHVRVCEALSFVATADTGAVTYRREATDEEVLPGVALPTTRRPYAWRVQGRKAAEEAAASGFVRESYAIAHFGDDVTLQVGKRQFHLGERYVYDDFAFGAEVDATIGTPGGWPLELGAALLLPARDWVSDDWTSPLVAVGLTLSFSPLESLRFEGFYFHDAGNAVAALAQAAVVEAAALGGAALGGLVPSMWTVSGPANLGFLVASLDLLLGDVLLHVRAVGVAGRALLRVVAPSGAEPPTTDVRVLGGGADVSAEWIASSALLVAPFVAVLSGDDASPLHREGGIRYSTSFVGVVPYWTFTNLFFKGGMNEAISQRGATPAGMAGHGVIALGAHVTVTPHDDVSLLFKGAYLWSAADVPRGGRGYGLELDLEVRWQALSWLALGVEGDILVPGGVFPGDAPFWKVLGGLDVLP